jgi:hypothetical protein
LGVCHWERRKGMKWLYAAVAGLALVVAGSAAAAIPPYAPHATSGPATIKTFGTGEVKKKDNGVYLIKNDPGEFGGVYYSASPHETHLWNLKFKFKSNGDVTAGGPKWNIPIDATGDGVADDLATITAVGCGATVGTNDANVETVVSTTKSNCKVFFQGVTYANWVAFYTAHPDYRLVTDLVAFIDAIGAGKFRIYGIFFP